MEEEESISICAYNLENMGLSYVGELYYDESDTERRVLILKNAIVRIMKAKQSADKSAPPVMETGYTRVPLSGRDSTVHIDTRAIKGVLVKDIDQDEAAEYRSANTRLHSKLHLA